MPGNAECEAAAERRGEAKPRARRLLASIGLREVARIKASATLKNEESLPPQNVAATQGREQFRWALSSVLR